MTIIVTHNSRNIIIVVIIVFKILVNLVNWRNMRFSFFYYRFMNTCIKLHCLKVMCNMMKKRRIYEMYLTSKTQTISYYRYLLVRIYHIFTVIWRLVIT